MIVKQLNTNFMKSFNKLSLAICSLADSDLLNMWETLTDICVEMDGDYRDGQLHQPELWSTGEIRELFVDVLLDAYHECEARNLLA